MIPKTAMVVGASGSLGRVLTGALLARTWNVIGVDIRPQSPPGPYKHVLLPEMSSAEEQLHAMLGAASDVSLDAVLNVAGGWLGGCAKDLSAAHSTELILRQSVFSSVAAAHVAARRGAANSLLLLSGSAAVLGPTPDMIGYGLAKAAVHHLAQSLAADPSKFNPGTSVVVMAPEMLDTPFNRSQMPNAETDKWTSVEAATDIIVKWAEGEKRPQNGSIALLKTANSKTEVFIKGM